MRHLFIINPAAGKRDQSKELSTAICKAMQNRFDPYEIYVTSSPLDACTKLRKEASSGEVLRVYACGGDGTLNEVVNGAMGFSNVIVAHYPCGTGNDFVKTFGLENVEHFQNIASLIDGSEFPIDIIECNKRYSINICSVGIDARIGADVHKFEWVPFLRGLGLYVCSLIYNLFRGINQPLKIYVGKTTLSGTFALVCACNGQYYGGGFHPVPDAVPNDGIMDCLIANGVSVFAFPLLVFKYAAGRFKELPKYITRYRCNSIEIESDSPLTINIDGEIISDRKLYFRLLPSALRFICPKNVDLPVQKADKQASAY